MTKRFGFTLAEVLITLGIIGVVAAMTMPTLMNSTNGAQYRTAYKKALSVLNQAVVLNVALDDFDLSQATTSGTSGDGVNLEKASLYSIFKNRMNVVKTSTAADYKIKLNGAEADFGGSNNFTLYFNDGIAFSFPASGAERNTQCTETNPCYGVIDVNGAKNPNKETYCDGETSASYDDTQEYTVSSPSDVYSVKMYDQTIVPTSNAGKAVLYGK